MQVKATSPLTHNISGTAKVTNLINILYAQVLYILYDTYTCLYIGSCTEPDGVLYMGQQGHIQGSSGHPPGQFYVYTRLVICIVYILFLCVCAWLPVYTNDLIMSLTMSCQLYHTYTGDLRVRPVHLGPDAARQAQVGPAHCGRHQGHFLRHLRRHIHTCLYMLLLDMSTSI